MTNAVSGFGRISIQDYSLEEQEAAACLPPAEPHDSPDASVDTSATVPGASSLAPAAQAVLECGEEVVRTALACAPVFVLAPETFGAVLGLLGPCVVQSTNLGKCLGQSYERASAEARAAEVSAACVDGGGVPVEQGDELLCRLPE